MRNLPSECLSSDACSRRGFFTGLASILGFSLASSWPATFLAQGSGAPVDDEELCRTKFQLAESQSLADLPVGEIMVGVGSSFIGTPYRAHTLEVPGPERLVINLHALDCVTFVENTLALSRCIKLRQHSFDHYLAQLQLIRYRGGRINGYPSRLHYFSDWIHDNAEKRVVRDVTGQLGGRPYGKAIRFMSAHREAYPQLDDEENLRAIATTESELNRRGSFSIPKEDVGRAEEGILSGDIIAVTTAVEGLDVSHTGVASRVNGTLRYLHAPLTDGTVQITNGSLLEYLMARPKHTGIMVARPLEPQA